MQLGRAIDVFARGFAAARSRTFPHVAERSGPLWVLHDEPRKNPKDQRRWEIVALAHTPPAQVMRRVRALRPQRFALCVVHDGEGRRSDVEAAYKSLGFRYMIHEPLFVRALPPAPRATVPEGVIVQRVRDAATAQRVAKTARTGQIRLEDVDDDAAARRLFAALDGRNVVGWVSSIRTHKTAAWVCNLHVVDSHRRRGIGRALMSLLLRDDVARGIRHSVLSASHAGTGLYRKLKYRQVGTLQVFVPRRK